MRIRSLHLKNIRSYVDETVEFPAGTVLLAGDIGSGKTTILLAIEFAIFGIMKGVVSTSALLRHGANDGSVELALSMENQEIVIKRQLRRKATNILQESGVLIVNGESFEGTPQELKSRILNLLGYPESLLTKSKSLIFRYTVFTPQEEMKRILYESKDERLDILRRLFNIDKYKRVKENALNITKEIKAQISFLEGKLEAFPAVKQRISDCLMDISKLDEEMRHANLSLDIASAAAAKKSEEVKVLDMGFEKALAVERMLILKKAEYSAVQRNLERARLEDVRLKNEIEAGIGELQGFDQSLAKAAKENLVKKQEELKKIEVGLDDIRTKSAHFLARKSNSEEILSKVLGLDKCPTCLQEVSPQHVEDVKIRENSLIHACGANLAKLDDFRVKYLARKKAVQEEIELLLTGEKEFARLEVKVSFIEEKKRRRELAVREYEKLSLQSNALGDEVNRLSLEWSANMDKKELAAAARKELEALVGKKSACESHLSGIRAKAEFSKKILMQLEEQAGVLAKEEDQLHRLKEKRHWLEEDFVGLVDVIEKSVLSRIYSEFNSYFEEWFSTLVEDENITAWLDDSFSPVLEQNGYETGVENLSGGEKTSVALAYRLSLNKVINDFMSSVRTRDLIILDEPTEGFSSEQLDRVRDVLAQAKVSQTIIVSHEPKMESFVDHVVRVRKSGHISRLASGQV